jgi:hypothetical protein
MEKQTTRNRACGRVVRSSLKNQIDRDFFNLNRLFHFERGFFILNTAFFILNAAIFIFSDFLEPTF